MYNMEANNKIYRAIRLGLISFFADDKAMAFNGFKVGDFDKCLEYLSGMYTDSVKYTTIRGDEEKC